MEKFYVDEAYLKNLKLKKDVEDEKKLRRLYVEKKNIEKQLYQSKDYSYDILEIDLSYQSISAEKLKQIAQSVQNYLQISQLFLCFRGCLFGNLGLQILEKSLKIHDLSKLKMNLSGCELGDEGCQSLSRALNYYLNLTELNLNLSYNHIKCEGVKYIAQSIENHEMISQLSLNFSQNSLNADAAKLLAKVIANYKNMKQLSLKLKRNSIGFEGAQSIADSIESSPKITSLKLNLSDCNIGTEQSQDISKLISEKLSGINHLFLNFNDNIQISSNEAKDFANIIKNQKNIKQLTVDFGTEINDKKIKNIKRQINQFDSIQQIVYHVKKNKNSVKACLEVFNEVQICELFTHLYINLDKNNINDYGANLIANSIQNLTKLTFVNLGFRDCDIAVNGIKSLANSLKDKKDIVQLNLDFGQDNWNPEYHLYIDVVQCISNTLQNLEKLTHVNFSLQYRYIKQEGAECLSNALKEKKNIKHLVLNLVLNKISGQTKQDLEKKLKELNPSFDIYFDF
ncbi:hypothetical protein ABPG74_002769 [Tetrahymena malaccensis]